MKMIATMLLVIGMLACRPVRADNEELVRAGEALTGAAKDSGIQLSARQRFQRRELARRTEQETDAVIASRLDRIISELRTKYVGLMWGAKEQKKLDPDTLQYSITLTWTTESSRGVVESNFYWITGKYRRTAIYTDQRLTATGNLLSDDPPVVSGPEKVGENSRLEDCKHFFGDIYSGDWTDCEPAS